MCDRTEGQMRDAAAYKEVQCKVGSEIRPSTESHMIYELRQLREHYIKKLIDIQVAIDATNNAYSGL